MVLIHPELPVISFKPVNHNCRERAAQLRLVLAVLVLFQLWIQNDQYYLYLMINRKYNAKPKKGFGDSEEQVLFPFGGSFP